MTSKNHDAGFPEVQTITSMWSKAFSTWAKATFVIAGDIEFTYEQVSQAAAQSAHGLRELGVSPGDRVAVWMSNNIEWVVAQAAATLCGAVLVPLNTRLRDADLTPILADSGAKVLITQDNTAEFDYVSVVARMIESGTIPSVETVIVVGEAPKKEPYLSWRDLLSSQPMQFEPQSPDLDDVCYILYTSGTTSAPKGVMLTHRNLNNSRSLAGGLVESDVILVEYPLFAITGCHNCVLAGINVGASLILHARFDPDEAVDLINRYQVTVYGGVSQTLLALTQCESFTPERVASLRYASIFPRRPEYQNAIESCGFEFAATGYGMTETAGPVTWSIELGDGYDHEGPPHTLNRVEIRRDDGSIADVNEVGSIYVFGPQVMRGYFNNPQATREAIGPDGALKTGDVGRLDSQGRLTWVGRSKEVYKSAGFNVAVLEVEEFLRTHPAVAEAAVLPASDPVKGQVGIALVRLNEGSELCEAELIAFARSHIASYKVPARVVFLDEFPKTASGKIRKVELENFVAGT